MRSNLKRKRQPQFEERPQLDLAWIASQQKKSQPKLRVYSSSPQDRLLARYRALTRAAINMALIGLFGSALSYFFSVSLESQVSHHLSTLEVQMKNREDLKSYLSRAYSWQNLTAQAEKMNFKEAKQIEIASGKKSFFHMIFN